MSARAIFWCCGCALLLAINSVVPAQQPANLLEPANTSRPAATLGSLIDACNELDRLIDSGAMRGERSAELLPVKERILDCLDLSDLPKELRDTAGIESALFLKEVLDRIELPEDSAIPAAENPLSPGEPLLRWQIPRTRIVIGRIEAGPQTGTYLFTPETLRRAAQDYGIVKALPYRSAGRAVSPGLYDAYLAATKQQPVRTADTSSPRGTLTLFLDSCNEVYALIQKRRYYERDDAEGQQIGLRIVSCLDTSQLPEYAQEYYATEAAACLKEVLDRTQLPPAEAIPGIENVKAADGSTPVQRWQVPGTQIIINRIQEGPRAGEFLFSTETVAQAREMYAKVQSLPYREDGRPVCVGAGRWNRHGIGEWRSGNGRCCWLRPPSASH